MFETAKDLLSKLNFWRPEEPDPAPLAPPPPPPSATEAIDPTLKAIEEATRRLKAARAELKRIDEQIAGDLSKLRSAQNHDITPTLDQIRAIKFPENIRNLAIETNTPQEIFAGVSYFLAIKPKEEGIHCSQKKDQHSGYNKEFEELCKSLVQRHQISREVFSSKSKLKRLKNEEYVPTFDSDQHQIVLARMEKYCLEQGYDSELHTIIIDWIAAVNAGWQDMAINDDTPNGSFIDEVTETSQYDIRMPESAGWSPVWQPKPNA